MANYREDFANVELHTGKICRNFMNHTIGSGDALGDRFGVHVFRDGEPVTLGGSCAGYFVRNNTGETIVISGGVVSGNEAYVTLPAACYAVEGSFTLAIKVTSGDEVVTLRIVDGMVDRTNTSVIVDPGNLVPSIEDLIDAIDAAVASIPADYSSLWTSLAPAFSTSTNYTAGQYVTYNGAVYQFTVDHPAGTWNSAHVTATNLGSELSSLKSAIVPFYDGGSDMNSIPTGLYALSNASYTNLPSVGSNMGYVLTTQTQLASIIFKNQVYFATVDGKIFTRSYRSDLNTWTDWIAAADSSEMERIKSATCAFLDANTDFDSISTGLHATSNAQYVHAPNVSNRTGFIFTTKTVYSQVTYKSQVYFASSEGKVFTRSYRSDLNTWTEWLNLTDSLDYQFETEITDYRIINGAYVNNDGSYVPDANSVIIDKIKVQPGKTIKITDVVLYGVRSICLYDSDGEYVRTFRTNEGASKKTFNLTNDGTFTYASITQTTSIESEMPKIEYVDAFSEIKSESIGQKRSIFEPDTVDFWNFQVSVGYVDYDGTTIQSSATGYRHTPFIHVTGGRTIKIKNFCSAVVRYLFAYDENKNVRYIPIASSSAAVTEYEYILPYDVYYIRYNLYSEQIETTSIEYTDTDVLRWNRETYYSKIPEKWFRKTSNKISTPFAMATEHPIITLIDDDTISVAATKLYHDACVNNEVIGGYAVLTQNLENDSYLKSQLLQYEDEGFSMNIHAYSQITAFDSGATRDIALAEANFCKGIRQMREFGFIDYMYWCTPYGVSDSDIQGLAKRHGLKCLIRSGINAIVTNDYTSRFQIPRASLNQSAESLSAVKNLVDKCASSNGWLLVTTHMAETGWEDNIALFNEFVTYAKGKGCQFKTISEAWRIWEPVFALYETC